MKKRPTIELLTPDLDLSVKFIPGYGLSTTQETISSSEITAIALALWELSATVPSSPSIWSQSQLNNNSEGTFYE